MTLHGRYGILNHLQLHCLFNSLFRLRAKKLSTLHLWWESIGDRGSPVVEWWRHQMETFSALLAICVGNSPVPAQRPVMRSLDVFFDLSLNKRLSEQSWGWWFEMLSHPLWRHCNRKVLRRKNFYVMISLLSMKIVYEIDFLVYAFIMRLCSSPMPLAVLLSVQYSVFYPVLTGSEKMSF